MRLTQSICRILLLFLALSGCGDSTSSVNAICGDGIHAADSEACDDGNENNEDDCLNDCTLPSCGDGFVREGMETCDDGNTITEECSYDEGPCEVCNAACVLVRQTERFCGDAVTDPEEGCDDGNVITESCTYGMGVCQVCASDCTLNELPARDCGDGVLDPEEECDRGAGNADECLYESGPCEICSLECRLVDRPARRCGDGTLDAEERCDHGGLPLLACDYDTGPCEGCGESCTGVLLHARRCGDGLLDPEEMCDGGEAPNTQCAYGESSCTLCLPNCEMGIGETVTCAEPSVQAEISARIEGWVSELTLGVSPRPTDFQVPEASMGTLKLTLNEKAFAVLADETNIYAAGSVLGAGRIFAYSGQDFISSHDRSTLLGNTALNRLLANAVVWAKQQDTDASPRVMVDSEAVAQVLRSNGLDGVRVTPILLQRGLWQTRDWTAEALADVDVAVVQVNEWGTLRVGPNEIESLRNFVSNGGGLVIAGSALHWSWWLSDSADSFIGDLILEGTGISWRVHSINDLSRATTTFSPFKSAVYTWCAYLSGAEVPTAFRSILTDAFAHAKTLGRLTELDQGLARLIDESPALPVTAADPMSQFVHRVTQSLPPHEWTSVHPWTETFPGLAYGEIVAEASKTFAANRSRSLPLGMYAPPGGVVKIEIPIEFTQLGLRIRVGERYDNLANLDHIEQWRRAPLLFKTFRLNTVQIEVGFAFGGALYLEADNPLPADLTVTVRDALPMTVFTRHESTLDDWQGRREQRVPVVILQEKGAVRLVVAKDQALLVEDPDGVIDFWTGFHQHHIDLASEPTARQFESHWIFDTQVGWGYANASNQRITYPKHTDAQALRLETGNEDWWLFGHELGHQFQTSDWTGGDVTEVCVNLFTMYTLNTYIYSGGNFQTLGRFDPDVVNHAVLRDMRWSDAGLFEKLDLYRQLIHEFGWDVMRGVFASYYDEQYPRAQYGSFMNGFALRMSLLSGRDLSQFFQHWQYPMDGPTAAQIQSLGLPVWMPPGW